MDIFLGAIVVKYVSSFCAFLDIQHTLYAKVMGVILVIEYVQLKDFWKFFGWSV